LPVFAVVVPPDPGKGKEMAAPPPLQLSNGNLTPEQAMNTLTQRMDEATAPLDKDVLCAWLKESCYGGHLSCVELLVARGATVSGRHEALAAACYAGSEAVARFLLENGASATTTAAEDGPLHRAVRRGNMHLVELLLDAGAAVDEEGRGGQTPLFRAIESKCSESVRHMLRLGADVNKKDADGEAPLTEAIIQRSPLIAGILLEAGAEPDYINGAYGVAALHRATADNRKDLVEVLLEHAANPDLRSGHGLSALHMAAEAGLLGVMGALIAKGQYREEKGQARTRDEPQPWRRQSYPLFAGCGLDRRDLQ